MTIKRGGNRDQTHSPAAMGPIETGGLDDGVGGMDDPDGIV